MSAEVTSFAPQGLPVEIGRIDKELGKLWEESGDSKTRASLINLAIYTEDASAVEKATALISDIASEHAFRAILIFANPSAPESKAQAWINAHCHLSGKRQICSEQITFQLDGDSAEALPSIVFSHLDSDLPLCFWWQGELSNALDEELWSWVDRLIFDSSVWSKPGKQLEIVGRIGSLSDRRTVLCDLNWTRLLNVRTAVASFFDHAAALPHLSRLESVEIEHAPGVRTTALLLLGWLASRLGWKLDHLLSENFFVTGDGRQVKFDVREVQGACIGKVVLKSADASFELSRASGEEYYHASMTGEGLPQAGRMLSAGRQDIATILLMELSRGGRHPQYDAALKVIAPLLDA